MTIRTGMLADSALIAKRLANDPLLVVASPDYLKVTGTPRKPQDLERHSCLVHGDACHWPFKKKTSDRSVRVSGRVRSNDLELLHRHARDGHGLLWISAAHVAEETNARYPCASAERPRYIYRQRHLGHFPEDAAHAAASPNHLPLRLAQATSARRQDDNQGQRARTTRDPG